MSAAARRSNDDLLSEMIGLARTLGLRRYGEVPVELVLKLPSGRRMVEPIPPAPCLAAPEREPAQASTDRWAAGPEPKALSDCQKVYWPGLGLFRFSPKQAAAVKLLWDARMESDEPRVGQKALLAAAGSDGDRLRDLFRNCGAWGTLILHAGGGEYRLPEVPRALDEGDDEG